MKMSIHEKVDQLTTSLMEVAGIPETIKDFYDKIPSDYRNIFLPNIEGMRKYPGSFQNIFRQALETSQAKNIERGGTEGAMLGGLGGAQLGTAIGARQGLKGAVDTIRPGGVFSTKDETGKKVKRGRTGKTKAISSLLTAILSPLAGTLGGALAGYRGGIPAGAAIAGAGSAGGLGYALGGAKIGVPLGFGAAALASDAARAGVRSRDELTVGGDPSRAFFRA